MAKLEPGETKPDILDAKALLEMDEAALGSWVADNRLPTFSMLDRDGDGTITKVDLVEMLGRDFSEADSTKWSFEEGWRFDGRFSYTSLGDKELVRGVAIAKGVERLKADPVTYAVLWFQAGMEEWPEQQQQFTLLRRAGTRGFRPSGVSKTAGAFQFAFAHYLRLPPVHSLLEPALDNFMSSGSLASYNGAGLRLHASPGRGEGLGDIPGLKLIGDIDPNDGTRPAPPPARKTMTALKSVVRGASSP